MLLLLLLLLLSDSAGVSGTVGALLKDTLGGSARGVRTSPLLHVLRTPNPLLYIPSAVTPTANPNLKPMYAHTETLWGPSRCPRLPRCLARR